MITKEEQEFLDEATKGAEAAVRNTLLKVREAKSKADFYDYIKTMADQAKMETEFYAGVEIESFCFDYDENGFQFLNFEKQIDKTILNLVPMTFKIPYHIYAADPVNPKNNSKKFYYQAFLSRIDKSFKNHDFEIPVPDLNEVFKFMQTPKNDVLGHTFYPELELVFDKEDKQIYASIITDNKLWIDDVFVKDVNEECKKLNTKTIPKTVKPNLGKIELGEEENVL